MEKVEKVLNKSDMVDAIISKTDLPKAVAERAVNEMMRFIVDSVSQGHTIGLVGFGSFKKIDRAARRGRNPQTGKEITIAASRQPKFVAGKAFKDAVNGA